MSWSVPAAGTLKGQALAIWKRKGNKLFKLEAGRQTKLVNKISPYFASVQEGSSTSCFPSQGRIQINEKEMKSVVNNTNKS